MRRWIWTILITVTMGLAIGCGSDGKSGSTAPTKKTPSTPATPSCTSNCPTPPPGAQFKIYDGDLQVANVGLVNKLAFALGLCKFPAHLYWPLGLQNCEEYDGGYVYFTQLDDNDNKKNDIGSLIIELDNAWGFVGQRTVLNLKPIQSYLNNTQSVIQGMVGYTNIEFKAIIENVDLNKNNSNQLKIRLFLRPFNQSFQEVGLVNAQLQ